MEYLINALTEPVNCVYLSGIFLIIFGATIGIAPPDSRKTLNTAVAIPIFILLGLINIFRSFNYIGDVESSIGINAFLQSLVIICSLELGRRNIGKAYSNKDFSKCWYIPIIIFLFYISYEYDFTNQIIRRILLLISKLFAIIVTFKATQILPNYNRNWVRSSFIVAFLGAFIQFILDFHFATVINGHYLHLYHESIYLFYLEIIATLVISILILVRRYLYEKNQRLHIPNTLSLMSPSVVFITSIIIALWILVGSNFSQDNSARVWLLFISMLVISILYLVMYGFTYNSENMKAIENAETNFKLIFQSAPDPICVISEEDSKILSFNKSMQNCFGYNESLIGKKLEDMIISSHDFQYNIPCTNEVVVSECKFKKANEEIFTAEVTTSYIQYGFKEALLLNIHDISMFKEIEEKLTEAKNTAEEANKVKSWLLANASHELRTPMTAIMGLSEMAASICQNDRQKEVIELLRISSKSLMSLINDMFDLAEAKKGKIQINKSPFILKTLLDEIIEYMTFLSKRRNKNILFRLSKNLPDYVSSDIDHIRHSLMAIIDYTSDISVNDNTLINLEFEKNNNDNENGIGNLIILISGINPDNKAEIQRSIDNSIDYSNPYHASLTRKFASRLTLHSLIINSLNGSISIDKKEKIPGTLSLRIEIPLEVINKETLPKEIIEENYFYYKGRPLNLLVADDNDVNIFLIESIINRFKGTCHSVRDGVEVLECLKDNDYDCILLDIQMPKLDGMQTLEEIRKMADEKSKIPIIAISAFASEKEKDKILKSGAQKYLAKPFYPKDLFNAISSIFQLDKELPEKINNNKLDNIESNSHIKENEINSDENTLNNLKRIDYKDFKIRISPNSKTIVKLDEIYNRRYMSLDIEIDNSINNNDSAKLREVVHSIKGLVGMMSAKKSWEIARDIEKKAGDGDFDAAVSRIGELRMHLAEIADDLKIIKEFLQ